MANVKNSGKVIGQVGGYRIRQTVKVGRVGSKVQTTGTTIGIYTGKNMIESGFKNKESAILRATQLQSQIVK